MAAFLSRVRASSAAVCQQAAHVSIDTAALQKIAAEFTPQLLSKITSAGSFDRDIHFFDGGPLTLQYLLVVDALNFCFWPARGLEYEHLARGVKAAVEASPQAISASRLATMDGPGVQALMGWQTAVPLQEERARLLREVGEVLNARFAGQAAQLVAEAQGSINQLVQLVVTNFPGFQDHAIYRGRQVFLYKRAQIFAGDVWGAFQGQGLGAFHDIHALTMFADYRVPVVLRQMGILQYSSKLAQQIEDKAPIHPGSEEEVEIRAGTIQAVELLKEALHVQFNNTQLALPHSVQLDWWLWDAGETARETSPPHHRTLTVFY
ncbi:hypothetical protein WJX72_011811 [[Myrmecia] bisecta]|uniref:Queuosine 5'-phosphate N-glycosylase/hydrolase n=1 Tax=[Myrmecia] bisecta TaxID=41462 RepID=A0AAW1QGJ5_9CHLO